MFVVVKHYSNGDNQCDREKVVTQKLRNDVPVEPFERFAFEKSLHAPCLNIKIGSLTFIGVICNWMCATHYLFVNKDSVKKRFTSLFVE